MKPIGIIISLLGAAGATYFFAIYDVSVSTDAGRVANMELMNTRQNGVIISIAFFIVGSLTALLAKPATVNKSPVTELSTFAELQWKERSNAQRDPRTAELKSKIREQLERNVKPDSGKST